MFLGTTAPVLRSGWLGVDVFFMLSGLILCHVYAAQFRECGIAKFGGFLAARIARVLPLHIFMLCVIVAVIIAVPGFKGRYIDASERFSDSCLVASAVLIQNWFHWLPSCWNTPSWSLSAEWLGYLLFPLFLFVTQIWRRPATALGLATLSLTAFETFLILKGVENGSVEGTPGLIRMALEFAAGCLIYRALVTGSKVLSSTADAVALFLLANSLLFPRLEFLAVYAIAIILILTVQSRGPIAKLMSSYPIIMLGEMSYSIYLTHWILLQLFNLAVEGGKLGPNNIALFRALLAISLLVIAYLTYRFIELPARAWGRYLGARRTDDHANADAM